MKLKALSVCEPWGTLISEGKKTLEIRNWSPPELPVRDLLIVQNGRRLDDGFDFDPDGRAILLVDVVDVKEWKPEDTSRAYLPWEPGWLAWKLSNVRVLKEPVPMPARRKLYDVEMAPELLAPYLPHTVLKVAAYIVREQPNGPELLIFSHRDFPDVPLQVPGGTVEQDEDFSAAAWREVAEEAGLSQLTLVGEIGVLSTSMETGSIERHFFVFKADEPLPDSWDHVVHGEGEDRDLVFSYRWQPMDTPTELAGNLGELLQKMRKIMGWL